MPVPKRYFKVSQEINHDPETWELTNTFGDRSIRIWLELLSILDRNLNEYKPTGLWLSQLAGATKTNLKTSLKVVLWMISRGWLHVSGDEQSVDKWVAIANKFSEDWPQTHRRLAEDLPEIHRRLAENWSETGRRVSLCASKWAKYNRSHEINGSEKGSAKAHSSLPSYPNHSESGEERKKKRAVDSVDKSKKLKASEREKKDEPTEAQAITGREDSFVLTPELEVAGSEDSFVLTAELRAWSAKEGIHDPSQYVDEFVDHWKTTGGKRKNGQPLKDWAAAFRNRIRWLKRHGLIKPAPKAMG